MSISRLQLAAALLEYDNDQRGVDGPLVHHRESALFRPFIPKPLDSVLLPPSPSYVQRRSQYSGHQAHLKEPIESLGVYGSQIGSEDRATQVEVSGWNIPKHLLFPDIGQNTWPPSTVLGAFNPASSTQPDRDLPPLRTVSGPSLRPQPVSSPLSDRITSVHLDMVDGTVDQLDNPELGSATSMFEKVSAGLAYNLAQSVKVQGNAECRLNPLATVPIPPDVHHRRTISNPLLIPLPPSPANRLESGDDTPRTDKDQAILVDNSSNPFAVPPPPVRFASKFDPKLHGSRRGSLASGSSGPEDRVLDFSMQATMAVRSPPRMQLRGGTRESFSSSDVFVRDPSQEVPAQSGQVKPGLYPEIPTAAEYGRPLVASRFRPTGHIDRRSLLRPKTLVMPASLADGLSTTSLAENIPEGYSLGEKPLPAASRTSIFSTICARSGIPLSLSQRTFRSSLLVDGKREEEEFWIGSAPEDATSAPELEEEEGCVVGPLDRRPGRLYGMSLMDQLETRKAAMKGKQRAFTGDSRPAMMARRSYLNNGKALCQTLASTLDPPVSEFILNSNPNRNSIPEQYSREALDRVSKSKSVFGIDQIWEKEMSKLKVMQKSEADAAAEYQAKELSQAKKGKHKWRKGNNEAFEASFDHDRERQPEGLDSTSSRTPLYAQTLAVVSPMETTSNTQPRSSYSSGKEGKRDSILLNGKRQKGAEIRLDAKDWLSSEEDDTKGKSVKERIATTCAYDIADGENSEDNVPLSKVSHLNAKNRHTRHQSTDSEEESEEDVSLSRLKTTSAAEPHTMSASTHPASRASERGFRELYQPTSTAVSETRLDKIIGPVEGDKDDDDVPLLLRKLGLPHPNPANETGHEDDIPLGYRHARTALQQGMQNDRSSIVHIPPNYPPYGHFQNALTNPPLPAGVSEMEPSQWMMMNGVYPYAYHGYPAVPSFGGIDTVYGTQHVPVHTATMKYGTVHHAPTMESSKNIDTWRKEVAVAPPTKASNTTEEENI